MINRLQKLLVYPILLLSFTASAQHNTKASTSQLTIITENDNYTLQYTDRYYTNGLMVRFSKAMNAVSAKWNKKILSVEGGQMIFTPYKQTTRFRETMDRPFTGFLYFKTGVTSISPKQNIWHWNVLTGVIGEAAKGKEIQRWHHNNFQLPYPYGWETQLKSEVSINVQGTYYQHLVKESNKKKFIDAHAKVNAIAGTTFTQLSSGLLVKIGLLNNADNSTWFDANLNADSKQSNKRKKTELFIYLEPSVTYQLYNATVQGGFFTHKNDSYTASIQPFYYSNNIGVVYAQGRYKMQLGFTHKTKEARKMLANENYGSIAVGYQL